MNRVLGSDERNRFFGNVFGTLEINDWLYVTAKGAVDTYNELREERRAVGSVATQFGILGDDEGSGYDRVDILFSEYNYDLMFNVNKQLTDDLSLDGVFGINVRKESYSYLRNSTARRSKKRKLGLIFHDKKDPIIPYKDALEIDSQFKNGQLISTDGFGHSLKGDFITEEIIKFLSH